MRISKKYTFVIALLSCFLTATAMPSLVGAQNQSLSNFTWLSYKLSKVFSIQSNQVMSSNSKRLA